MTYQMPLKRSKFHYFGDQMLRFRVMAIFVFQRFSYFRDFCKKFATMLKVPLCTKPQKPQKSSYLLIRKIPGLEIQEVDSGVASRHNWHRLPMPTLLLRGTSTVFMANVHFQLEGSVLHIKYIPLRSVVFSEGFRVGRLSTSNPKLGFGK